MLRVNKVLDNIDLIDSLFERGFFAVVVAPPVVDTPAAVHEPAILHLPESADDSAFKLAAGLLASSASGAGAPAFLLLWCAQLWEIFWLWYRLSQHREIIRSIGALDAQAEASIVGRVWPTLEVLVAMKHMPKKKGGPFYKVAHSRKVAHSTRCVVN